MKNAKKAADKTKQPAMEVAKGNTLTLSDVFELEAELGGIRNPVTGEKTITGLMGQKLKLSTKFELLKLHNQAVEIKTNAEKLRDELIKTLATEKDEQGNETIKPGSPEFKDFAKQWNELLKSSHEINVPKFNINDFADVNTDETYFVFMSLLDA
jgi:hypothetical protein